MINVLRALELRKRRIYTWREIGRILAAEDGRILAAEDGRKMPYQETSMMKAVRVYKKQQQEG